MICALWLLAALLWPTPIRAERRPAGMVEPAPAALFPLQVGWTTELGAPPATRPGYDSAHAYVPLRDGTLSAVRLRDGEVTWNIDQASTFPPATGGGTVVVADGANLVALEGATGQQIWSRDLPSPVSAPLLRGAGWLIAPLDGGQLLALESTDGREIWRRPLGGPLRTQPAFGGNRLFVPIDDGRLAALDVTTGALLWEQPLSGNPREVLPLDAVFVGTTGNYLYRISPSSGRIDWRWRTGGDVIGAPIVDEERVYFASLDNMVWALDRNSGVQRWREVLPRRPRAVPGLVGELLLVSSVSEQLPSFKRETGEPGNAVAAPGELGAPPYVAPSLAAAGLRMVFLVADGRLVGMRRPAPPPAWSLVEPLPPLQPVTYGILPSTPIAIEPVTLAPVLTPAGIALQ
ncbi:MAG: PQQ-binding-like beta-propeller repeat protein [Acidobacteria bacterium]|nr:PQQ-binding-like beta-propeller repeat protein [Acidobacteriota bacterium]